MLHLVQNLSDKFVVHLNEDPVRPHIAHMDRVGNNKDIFVLRDDEHKAKAITCVSYQGSIPSNELELFEESEEPNIAVFYTIWSYKPGSGRQLIFDAVKHIKQTRPGISRFITLSPRTDTARKFHLRNGAVVHRENTETVNYEYVFIKE